MLIDADGQVYCIDRDNSVFKVSGITFFQRNNYPQPLVDTLLEGVSECEQFVFCPFCSSRSNFPSLSIFQEMVIDNHEGKLHPRYLVYDIIKLLNEPVSKRPFAPDRFNFIQVSVYICCFVKTHPL